MGPGHQSRHRPNDISPLLPTPQPRRTCLAAATQRSSVLKAATFEEHPSMAKVEWGLLWVMNGGGPRSYPAGSLHSSGS